MAGLPCNYKIDGQKLFFCLHGEKIAGGGFSLRFILHKCVFPPLAFIFFPIGSYQHSDSVFLVILPVALVNLAIGKGDFPIPVSFAVLEFSDILST